MTNATKRPIEASVGDIRSYFAQHRVLAMWLIMTGLLVKIAVPPGYMPVISGGAIVIELCSGNGPEKMTMPMPEMGDHHGKPDHPAGGDMPCGFDGHAPSVMAGTDPILLVLAIAFIVATLFRIPVSWPAQRASYLRPYLRGPPAIA